MTFLQNGFPNRAIAWLLLLLFATAARQSTCRRRNTADSDRTAIARTARPADFLVRQLPTTLPANLQSMSAKAQLFTEQDGESISANANIIWLRDSVIWVNIKKFGLEAFRALITPDSIVILNRLENTYAVKTWHQLQQQYGLPAGFDLLQPTLLGQAWLAPDITYQADVRDSLHRLSGSSNRLATEYRLEEGNFRLRGESFRDLRDSRAVALKFDRYEKLPVAGWFSYLRRVDGNSPDQGAVQLTFELSDVEFNTSPGYRFDIPAHYKREQ